MRVLGLITARGGSKGVPGKNIKPLCGKPLLAYTTDAALASNRLSKVVLTTDDPDIAEVGRSLGVEVPFLRPATLAEDATPTFPVVVHAIEYLEKTGETFDAICLLQPTNPFRKAEEIDRCIELLESTGADSVISVVRVPHQYNPKWVYLQNESGEMQLSTGESAPTTRRQDLPPAFCRDGSIYVTRRHVLDTYGDLYGRSVRGFESDEARSVNIDTMDDWEAAERLIGMDATRLSRSV